MLTDAQARILRAMRDGTPLVRAYGPSIKRHFWTVGVEDVRASSADALLRRAYVKHVSGVHQFAQRFTYALTPAGAEALAAWEAGQ